MDQAEKRGVVLIGVSLLVLTIVLAANHWRKPVVIRSGRQPPAEIVGVGLYLGRNLHTHKFEVRRVFPNSPAERAGLTAGLILNKVDGIDAESKNIKDLSKLLSGPIGSSVTLEMMDTNGDLTPVTIMREKFLNRSSPK